MTAAMHGDVTTGDPQAERVAQHKQELERWQRLWLNSIKAHAKWIRYSGEQMSQALNELRIMPDFQTEAEAELKKSELVLMECLLAVKIAKRELERARGVVHLEAAE